MRFDSWKSVTVLAAVMAAYYAVFTHAQAKADEKAAAVIARRGRRSAASRRSLAMKGLCDSRVVSAGGGGGGGGGGTMTMVMMGPARPGGTNSSQQIDGARSGSMSICRTSTIHRYRQRLLGMTRTEGFEGGAAVHRGASTQPGHAGSDGQPGH